MLKSCSTTREVAMTNEGPDTSNNVDVQDTVNISPTSSTMTSTERESSTAAQTTTLRGARRESLKENNHDPWQLPSLSLRNHAPRAPQAIVTARPKPSLSRLSSLDNMLLYRDERAEWKGVSSLSQQMDPFRESGDEIAHGEAATGRRKETEMYPSKPELSRFRHIAAEAGFCFTIAMTQFLAEYLITGFAIELYKLPATAAAGASGAGSTGIFWPASLLSLILSATLLFFARVSDMHGGYSLFMAGVAWLAIWTLIPSFCKNLVILDVSRAMQGLAMAAFMPATFTMLGSIYPEGPRRNFVVGLYTGCAPLGFFGGLFTAAALPADKSQWYFGIAASLSGVTVVTGYLSVPSDRTNRKKVNLTMDWIGSFLIVGGLLLVCYALAAEPSAGSAHSRRSGFGAPTVFAPLTAGMALLALAFWYEGWHASCPLLPLDFFKPKSVKALSLACLCFYATYGVWLYNSAQYLQNPTGTAKPDTGGMNSAIQYLPTVIGGLVLCVGSGSLLHRIPMMVVLICSAVAWIAAPLLLALAPLPLNYWKFVMPSMVCATLGIDLTFTVSIVFILAVSPIRYQGLGGAVCSILVNLAMSLALPISGIVCKKAENTVPGVRFLFPPSMSAADQSTNWGMRAAFIYASASAGLGFAICVLFVRISHPGSNAEGADEESCPVSSSSTLVGDAESMETGCEELPSN